MLSSLFRAARRSTTVLRRYATGTPASNPTAAPAALDAKSSMPCPTDEALAYLRAQPSHYVVASMHGRKYLVAPRDLLTVARLRGVRVGDRLRLSEIHEVGSRDFTLRGSPVLPKGIISVEATVVEHTKGAMERIVKFKRRKHYQKTIEHKQPYTRLRIGPIDIRQFDAEME